MTSKLFKLFNEVKVNTFKTVIRYKSQRRTLGKPPEEAKNLQQRLQELSYKDPVLSNVDIGFAVREQLRRDVALKRSQYLKKNREDPNLEKASRNRTLEICLKQVSEEWAKSMAPHHIRAIAEHYSIFEHLFGYAYFHPVVTMDIDFMHKDRAVPVYWGNVLAPELAVHAPTVDFQSTPDTYWTLVMTSPDGNLVQDNMEFCHWIVTNIKGGQLTSGQVIMDYIQPLPVRGIGYQRYIFILYKQHQVLDLDSFKKKKASNILEERVFSSYQFYKERQDLLTPAGLSFFTATWDHSVSHYFNTILNLDLPNFHYDFPAHYYKKQTWFPLKQPFNLYLDRYRDQKEIAKEHLIRKLKSTHPFKDKKKPLPFPNAIPFKAGTPSWLKNEMIKERLKLGRFKDYQ